MTQLVGIFSFFFLFVDIKRPYMHVPALRKKVHTFFQALVIFSTRIRSSKKKQ